MHNATYIFRGPRLAAVFVSILVAALAVALMSVRASVSEASGCTNASIAGAYGLTATGTIFGPNGTHSGIALVGRTVYDGHGGLTGTQTDSQDGSIERFTLAGTYSVQPDCTGTQSFTFRPGGEMVHADFVVVADSHAIFFVDTDPGVVLTVSATRQ
jgi:hypothetical protein